MNSSIQCLMNSFVLKEYIISGEYEKHINVINKLGRKGEVICSLAELV